MSKKDSFHPVHNVHDGLFNTTSGTKISIQYPTAEMILIEDIAAALSKICRFGGHVRKFYSVAQHSCLVASLLATAIMLEGLLHDGSEAYLGDVIKPLKVMLGAVYGNLEGGFEQAIRTRFGLRYGPHIHDAIKRADMLALELEHEAFQKGNFKPLKRLSSKVDLSDDFTRCWPPDEAYNHFMVMFNIIIAHRNNR
ncbi:hypothetical protein SAMN05428988_1338 [Chitinophaga sp. YR573]|uniref:hypothetical protein n=1 Tax=Chitinophaga sp. YR573 TaxID=1881040 RepID=UPI0008D02A78|nr:hypothetical protein [Chitinophaga sp. YR573]SEW02196.1 hypothetical protein SAMN05428988_1338 [Chitinophaga sp. YR573]